MDLFEKKVEEYKNRPHSMVFVPEEDGGYSASIPEFKGCFSQGETIFEAYCNLQEAKHNWVVSTVRAQAKQGE